jgi:hypothetical protein
VRALALPDARTQRKLDLARTGLAIKAGEKLKDVTVTLATNAASLQGEVKVDAGAKAPARLRIHLVPAEQEAADEVLRYFETDATNERAFAFQHLAPGCYWLLTRALAQDETAKQPAAWDNAERAKLRREAEAAKNVVELQPCQRLKDYALKYAPK